MRQNIRNLTLLLLIAVFLQTGCVVTRHGRVVLEDDIGTVDVRTGRDYPVGRDDRRDDRRYEHDRRDKRKYKRNRHDKRRYKRDRRHDKRKYKRDRRHDKRRYKRDRRHDKRRYKRDRYENRMYDRDDDDDD